MLFHTLVYCEIYILNYLITTLFYIDVTEQGKVNIDIDSIIARLDYEAAEAAARSDYNQRVLKKEIEFNKRRDEKNAVKLDIESSILRTAANQNLAEARELYGMLLLLYHIHLCYRSFLRFKLVFHYFVFSAREVQ